MPHEWILLLTFHRNTSPDTPNENLVLICLQIERTLAAIAREKEHDRKAQR